MKKWVEGVLLNRRWISRCVVALFILSLLPLLVIAVYNHPSADDFSFGSYTVDTWRETGSLAKTMQVAKEGTQQFYNSWQGSFAAVFLMMLHPAIFNETLYILVPIVLLLGLVGATMLLLKIILMDYLRADRHSYLIIAALVSFLTIQFIVSPVEGIYWYNGAMYYTGFYILTLLLFSLLLLAMRTDKRYLQVLYTLIMVPLGVMIGGSNFVVALTASVIMALFFLYRLCFMRGKWLIPLAALVALGGALLISVTAPGNAIRQENFQAMNPILAILMSFWYGIRFTIYFVPLPIYFAFGCIASLIYKTARASEFRFRCPGGVTALLYGVYASTYTPNLYAMSSFGPARVLNVNYYTFLLFVLFTIIYWCGWIARRLSDTPVNRKSGKKKLLQKKEKPMEPGMIGLLVACFVVGCLLVSSVNSNAMASISALNSLITGEAKTYHQEYLARLALYEDPTLPAVEVSAFTQKPHVLYFDDITTDPADWRNVAVSGYYGKDSVVLKQE